MADRSTFRLAVVLPAYNEARTIGALVQRLRSRGGVEVVVVDDHSEDDTAAIARAAGAVVLCMPFRFGAWTATQAGLRYAVWNHIDAVVTMDADGQHDPDHLETLVSPIREGRADLVIGACIERASRLRKLAWRWLRWLSALDVADLTSGYRAYSKRAIAVGASWHATNFDYQDVGLLMLMRQRGLRILEVSVPMAPRLDGKSRIFSSWFQVARYMAYTSLLGWSKRRAAEPARLPPR